MSRYAETIGQNQWSGGTKIMPLSLTKAREWAEEHLTGDEYEQIFGLPDEDAEPETLYVQMPAQLMARIKARAAGEGTSVAELVRRVMEREMGE